jgi:hypothetical protein
MAIVVGTAGDCHYTGEFRWWNVGYFLGKLSVCRGRSELTETETETETDTLMGSTAMKGSSDSILRLHSVQTTLYLSLSYCPIEVVFHPVY